MAEELGKIEKLDIEQFGLRKLYVVPLIFSAPDAPPDYKEKLEKYWREVNEQIANQEVKVGKIQRIYHESMSVGGAEGLKIIAEINPLSHLIAKDKFENGAVFEATEQAELSDECMDWDYTAGKRWKQWLRLMRSVPGKGSNTSPTGLMKP